MTDRRFHCALLVLLSVCALGRLAVAQEVNTDRYARVKAGFVLNFLRLTQWPEETFEDETSPIAVVIVENVSMTPLLRELVEHERIGDRRINVRVVAYPQPPEGEYDVEPERMERFERTLRSAHLLFIGRDQRTRLSSILKIVEDHPVLTVSDIPRFAERGGMLGLALRDNRLAIDAHPERIRERGIVVSSRVLRLARIVEDPEQTTR